jgi:hypothetical protein
MDAVIYEHHDGRNVRTLVKRLGTVRGVGIRVAE